MSFPPCNFLTYDVFNGDVVIWFHQCHMSDSLVAEAASQSSNFIPIRS